MSMKDIGGLRGSMPECLICFSAIEYESILPCQHSGKVCGKCAVRMARDHDHKQQSHFESIRRENKKSTPFSPLECPFCKKEWKYIVLASEGNTEVSEWSSFNIDGLYKVGNMNVFATTSEVSTDFERLISIHCIICWQDWQADTRFKYFSLLQAHLRSSHGKNICMTCAEHRTAFVSDLELYTEEDLAAHLRKGSASVDPHPLCEFCRKRFYCRDELYAHCERDHESCHLCRNRTENKPRYFQNYSALESHFQKAHFLCEDADCKRARFIVFSNELDLRAHRLSVHRDKLTQKQRREMSTLQIDLVYRPVHGALEEHRSRGRRQNAVSARHRSPSPSPVDASNNSSIFSAAASTSAVAEQNLESTPAPVASSSFLAGAWSEQRNQYLSGPITEAAFPSLHRAHGRQRRPPVQDQSSRPVIQASHISPYQQRLQQQSPWAQEPTTTTPNLKRKQRKKQEKQRWEQEQRKLEKREQEKRELEKRDLEEKEQENLDQERRKQREKAKKTPLNQAQVNQTMAGRERPDFSNRTSGNANDKPADGNSIAEMSRSGLPLPDPCPKKQLKSRKRLMEKSLRRLLQNDEFKVQELFRIFGEYQSGSILASEFFKFFVRAVGGLHVTTEPLLLEIIALIPDVHKRRALHTVYRASFEHNTAVVQEPRPPPQLDQRISQSERKPCAQLQTQEQQQHQPQEQQHQREVAPAQAPSHWRAAVAGSGVSLSNRLYPVMPSKAGPAPRNATPAVYPAWNRRTAPEEPPAPAQVLSCPALQSQPEQLPVEDFPALLSSRNHSGSLSHEPDSSNHHSWGELIEPVTEMQPQYLSLSHVAHRRLQFLVRLAQDGLVALQDRIHPDKWMRITQKQLKRPQLAARSVLLSDLDCGVPLRNLGIEVRASELLQRHSHNEYDIVQDWICQAFNHMCNESLYILIDYVLTLYANIAAKVPRLPAQHFDQTQPSTVEATESTATSRKSRKNRKNKKQTRLLFG